MAELLQGWKRTHYCAEPTVDEVGKEMVLMGWAGPWRNGWLPPRPHRHHAGDL